MVAALSLAACTETPTTVDTPPASSMTYKQGARYEYESYNTDTTGAATDTSRRRRTWTLVNTSATVQARSNVAVYIDSIFSVAGAFSATDSVLLQQQPGTNDVYRYGSLLGELDISTQIPFLGGIDIGRKWNHEARLNSTVGAWLMAELADTVANTFGIPAISGFKISLTDNAVSSAQENITIGGTSYATTRATHEIKLAVTALVTAGQFTVPIEVGSVIIPRRIWIAPSLGAIVKEEREAKVLQISYQGQGAPPVPIPGYVSVMTRVIVTGG